MCPDSPVHTWTSVRVFGTTSSGYPLRVGVRGPVMGRSVPSERGAPPGGRLTFRKDTPGFRPRLTGMYGVLVPKG